MGSTLYPDLTAQEAIEQELRGTHIMARSGNWVMWKNVGGHVGLTYFITRRYSEGVSVKGVEINMGPNETPPASIARKYIKAYNGDVDAAGGEYGAPVLRKAVAPKPKAMKPGDRFRFEDTGVRSWRDGYPWASEYTYLGGFRAERADGVLVRLHKTWRKEAKPISSLEEE